MWKSMVLYTPWPSTQRVMNNGDGQILIPYGILKISTEKLLVLSTCCWKECWIINATGKLQNLAERRVISSYMGVNSRYWGFGWFSTNNFAIWSSTEFIFPAVLILLYLQYLLEHTQPAGGARFVIAPVAVEILRSMWKSMVLSFYVYT